MVTDLSAAPAWPAQPASPPSGPAPGAGLPGADLLALSPAATALLDAQGRVCWANEAFVSLLGAASLPASTATSPIEQPLAQLLSLEPAAALALAATLAQPAAELQLAVLLAGVPRWLQAAVRGLPDGRRLLVLTPIDALKAAESEAAHATELLELAQGFERLGVWERNVRTLQGRWDRHVFRFWGFDEQAEAPDFSVAARAIVDDDRPGFEAAFQHSSRQAGNYSHRFRVKLPDGAVRHLHSQWIVKNGADQRPERVFGILMDDTPAWTLARSQHAVESQLARRFELVTRTAGLGVWSLEGEAPRAVWSEHLRAIHGLAAGAPVPTLQAWLSTFVHPDEREAVQRRFADWVKSGRSHVEADFRIVRSDGEVREVVTHSHLEGHGRHPLLFGVVVDVTERRSAAFALRQAAQRAALAARGAGLGTWEQSLRDGRAYWDEQMWRLRGLEPMDEPPSPARRLALVHPDDRATVQQQIEASMQRDEPTNYEFRIVLPDGQVRWLASRSAPVRDEQGQTVRRIGVNWDVTDRRTAEAARQDREIALRESQAKSTFLARMSHELRTPLNAVLGFTELLLRDPTPEAAVEKRRQHLEVIRSAGQHLLSLIDDVLDLTSLEGGGVRIALAPVALAPLVAELLPLLEPLRIEHGISVHTDGLDLLALADATRLRQVLLNLLSNALKYNRPGGRVRLSASRHAGQLRLRVEDSGRGMTPQQLQHLFEPFNRLGIERESIEGTGIGLVIVKSLVERMGGTLQVQSTAGVGSVFELRLVDAAGPTVATAAPAALALLATAAALPPARQGTLLYVEDNPVNALIVAELVARRPGLTLHLAPDGASGVAQALALQPDLVLLDMQLPDFDGHEVLRRLRADPRTARIPCIAVSANAMPADIARALQAGMADYWTKPLDFRAFMASIDALFAPRP